MQRSQSTPVPDAAARGQEEALILNAQQGDRTAFASIYRLHYTPVVGYLYRRTGDAHAAEDLAADTFLAAYRAISKYRQTGAPFRMWLLRIATNAANRWARRRARFTLHIAAASTCQAAACPAPDLDESQAALLALPPDHQAVLSLHYLESLSLDEVAEVLGCKVGTVKSRLFRARAAMRDELNRRSNRHG